VHWGVRVPRQQRHGHEQDGEVGHGHPPARDERGEHGQRQGRRANDCARLVQSAAQAQHGFDRVALMLCGVNDVVVVVFAAGNVRAGVGLEARQDPRGAEPDRDEHDGDAMPEQPREPVVERSRLGGDQQCSIGEPTAEHHNAVVRELSDIKAKELAQGQTAQCPTNHALERPSRAETDLRAERDDRNPGRERNEPRKLAGREQRPRRHACDSSHQRPGYVEPEDPRERKGRQPRKEQLKPDERRRRPLRGEQRIQDHAWEVRPSGLRIGGEGQAGGLVGVPARNIPRAQPRAEIRVPGEKLRGPVAADEAKRISHRSHGERHGEYGDGSRRGRAHRAPPLHAIRRSLHLDVCHSHPHDTRPPRDHRHRSDTVPRFVRRKPEEAL
jgi:hypothetical protein